MRLQISALASLYLSTSCQSVLILPPGRKISTSVSQATPYVAARITVTLDILKWRARRPDMDDVESLSRGKPSKSKVGSRSVPHHLCIHERGSFEAAKRRGFCSAKESDRANVANIWYLWCQAKRIPCIHVCQYRSADRPDDIIVDLSTLEARRGHKGIACITEAYRKVANGIAELVVEDSQLEDKGQRIRVVRRVRRKSCDRTCRTDDEQGDNAQVTEFDIEVDNNSDMYDKDILTTRRLATQILNVCQEA